MYALILICDHIRLNNLHANRNGQATTQTTVNVATTPQVTMETEQESQRKFISSIEQLEAYKDASSSLKSSFEEIEYPAPVFTKLLENVTVNENSMAHFEARLEPVGDPSLRIKWELDGREVAVGGGFVILTWVLNVSYGKL